MNNWLFESENTSFSLSLPDNWAEYEDEENTSAFFNVEKWSGNLRITTFRWANDELQTDKVSEYIRSELNDNHNSQLIKLGEWDTAFYSKEIDDESLIYYWVTGINNHLFLCSFTFDKSFLDTENHFNEIITVTDILKSISVI